MGGQFNYWGLWLNCEYGHGECSESCTTFKNYTQLSVNKKFEIRNIEVWEVGEKPKNEDVRHLESKFQTIDFLNIEKLQKVILFCFFKDDEGQMDSILDGHLEERAVLEMAGRGRVSEGYRDKPTDLEFQN